VPVDLSAGAAGLYFALPPAGIAAPARVAWQIALAAFLAALIAAGARAAARSWRDPCDGRPRLFLAAALAAIAMPAVVGAAGRWWPAGKLLAMVAPLIVLVLALPALLPPTRAPGARLPAWLLIASGLALGVVRPIAAADPSGIAYRPPYPSAQDPRLKADYDWDLERHRAALRRCRAIVLDVADPFLDWYAQIFLDELGRPWSSARPVAEYYGAGRVLGRPPPVADPDCLVTTVLRPAEPGRRVFWLARDRQLEDFVRGTRPSIALAPATPIGVETSGLHDGDGRIRWTDGSATFRLPIDPRAPVRHVALSLWPIGLAPPRTLTVRINGAVLHAGAIADALALEWTLGDLGAAPMLEIALSSDTFRAEGDSRALGLALRALVVSH
jgi:hypothetical protein